MENNGESDGSPTGTSRGANEILEADHEEVTETESDHDGKEGRDRDGQYVNPDPPAGISPPDDPDPSEPLITTGVKDIKSMDLLLSGEFTSRWMSSECKEVPDNVSPNTLITDHPEAVLQEGRTINYFECPDCGFMIEVTTNKRPLEVTCASCKSRFRLKGKKQEEPVIEEEISEETDWDRKSQLSEEAMKYHRRGDLNRAVELYDEILEISNNDPVVWNNKGVALDGLGMHILAIKCYEKSIQLRDSYIDAWFNYAYSQYRMKQFEKAIVSLRKLLQLKPDHNEGNQLLDKCEKELKEWKKFL